MGTIFGLPNFKVIEYWDDIERSSVDILICKDRPAEDATCYGTVRLSDHPLINSGVEFSSRLELVGVCNNSYEKFPNILSTAAFYIINNQWFCCPGTIFCDIVEMYYENIDMKHLLFATPLLWGDDDWETERFGDKTVAWLMIIPISEKERIFAEKNGSEALEDLVIEREIDVFDLRRPSVL